MPRAITKEGREQATGGKERGVMVAQVRREGVRGSDGGALLGVELEESGCVVDGAPRDSGIVPWPLGDDELHEVQTNRRNRVRPGSGTRWREREIWTCART